MKFQQVDFGLWEFTKFVRLMLIDWEDEGMDFIFYKGIPLGYLVVKNGLHLGFILNMNLSYAWPPQVHLERDYACSLTWKIYRKVFWNGSWFFQSPLNFIGMYIGCLWRMGFIDFDIDIFYIFPFVVVTRELPLIIEWFILGFQGTFNG